MCNWTWERIPNRACSIELVLEYSHGIIRWLQTSTPARSKIAPMTATEAAFSGRSIRSRMDLVALFKYPRHSWLIFPSVTPSAKVSITAFNSAGSSTPVRKTESNVWNSMTSSFKLNTGSAACLSESARERLLNLLPYILKEKIQCKSCLLCFINVLSLDASMVCKSNNLFEGESADVVDDGESDVLLCGLSCVLLGDCTFCFSWSSRFALIACLIACDRAKRLVVGSFAAAGLWIAMKRKEGSEKLSATRYPISLRIGLAHLVGISSRLPYGQNWSTPWSKIVRGWNWLLSAQSRRN